MMHHAKKVVIAIFIFFAPLAIGQVPSTNTMMPQEPKSASFAELDRRAAAGQPISVVFFGGSLTWGANSSDPQRTSYRALMGQYLCSKYPHSPIALHDASIGGTGSQLGIFRIDRDVLAYKPDLVFLDFTLNDGLYATDPQSLDSYETILHELISKGIPVEQLFFAGKSEFVPKYQPERVVRVVAHKKLAAAYGTAVGDVYPTVQNAIEKGPPSIRQIWPFDGTHPDDPGYRLFFESARDGFEQAIREQRVCHLPDKPVFSDSYVNRQRISLVDSSLPEGWARAKTYRTSMWFDGLPSRWMGDVAMCDIKDRTTIKPLMMDFSGTFVGLFGEADADGLAFKVKIDGEPLLNPKPAKDQSADVWSFRPPTSPGRLFVWRVLSTLLKPGKHSLVLEPITPQGVEKGQLRIESLCVAGE